MRSVGKQFETGDEAIYRVQTRAPGPAGRLPLTPEMLLQWPSGDIFGWTQDVGMGLNPDWLGRPEVLILSTSGGLQEPDGRPVALGFHTGHWEVHRLVDLAARELHQLGLIPFAGFCTDPCDGRTQGTVGMFDSLPYRNDAAIVLRRLIRSLPTRRGVIGVATCDKGLPAMLMALAAMRDLSCVVVPGGVTLMPEKGEDAGTVQTVGARFAHGKISLEEAAEVACRACASPGGGCQFLGTAATSQVIAEALGLAVPHSALAPSGLPVWLDNARRSAHAVAELIRRGIRVSDILVPESIRNAMVVHAAFGGSTNLLIHLPAIAHAAGLPRPSVQDWIEVNRKVSRLVDVLPNGPNNYPTVCVFLAGGVPEVMLHLAEQGLLETRVLTVTGQTLAEVLEWWRQSERRRRFREKLKELEGIDPDNVIMSPERARSCGLTATVCFPTGNIAPGGSVVKSTAIAPELLDHDGVYRRRARARVFTSEPAAIQAIKSHGNDRIRPDEVIVLAGRGPMGSGMEETYQITSALKHIPEFKHIPVITDARFSGVSTGPCIGHVSPEALAGGPIGKLIDGDMIDIYIDTRNLEASIHFIGHGNQILPLDEATRVLQARPLRPDLKPDPLLPPETRLWAALQEVSGGCWGGCVYDVDAILKVIQRGRQAVQEG